MLIRGPCRIDKKTKLLVQRLQPYEIPIIDHIDLDELAAEMLIEKRVKAVINIAPSLSGKYPARGPEVLLAAGIPLIDTVKESIMREIEEGTIIEISNNQIKVGQKQYYGRRLTQGILAKELALAEKNMETMLEDFALNTFNYGLKEIKSLSTPLAMPQLRTSWKNQHVLLVVRGQNYKKDLLAIEPYIAETKPFLIGVDGGADALLENGYTPDLIFGDMDSVSDRALHCGAEIVVHAYTCGLAPGENRIKKLGLFYHVLPAPGTSEDGAMLLAYQGGAELIVALGTHSNLIDFFNKGREGMASTFLVRLRVGTILVDAKGVSKLYKQKIRPSYFAKLIAAAFLPFAIIAVVHPNTFQIIRLLMLRLRLLFGW